MAKKKNGVNKSQAVRELLTKNPGMVAKEVITALAEQGIEVNPSLYYFVKGKMKGRKGRRLARHKEAGVAAPSANGNALSTILKVKRLADDVGGLKQLKALVDASSA